MPRVAVIFTGGTISTVFDPIAGGNVPVLDGAAILARTPGLESIAEVVAIDRGRLAASHLTFAQIIELGGIIRDALADPTIDGAVLVQGTDTIEESVYLLDLLWDRPEPLVVTGAMRAAAAAGADGPANLLAAAVVAAAPASRDRGALVVLNDAVHAASRVRKTDSVAMHAFSSGAFGPVGRVHEGTVTFAGSPSRWPALPAPQAGRDPRVALLETHLGDRGELLRLVAADGWDGIVLAGFGVGHVSAQSAEAVGEVAARCPVVLASRTGDGPVLSRTYGFVGSEQDLLARGVIPAGWLDARKARLLLWALLAAGTDPAEVRAAVEARGAAPSGPMG